MNGLRPILRKLRKRDVRIIVNTRNPEQYDEEYTVQAIAATQVIDVMVLYTVRLHRKLAIIPLGR